MMKKELSVSDRINIRKIVISVLAFLLLACGDTRKQGVIDLLESWQGKEIQIPTHATFTIQRRDTVTHFIQNKYKIITYADSIGCISCKLKLLEWKKFMLTVDSLCPDSVQFLFFFCPNRGIDIYQELRMKKFNYPVCIDKEDELNKLNHFPSNTVFQTFLLDKENKVLVVGNPVHNSKIKDLYLKVIQGNNTRYASEDIETEVLVKEETISWGEFDWELKQEAEFVLRNIGNVPLVIYEVVTSCGCTSVEYSKEPVQPGESVSLNVIYRAEHPEYFSKTITVYCNIISSPLNLTVLGNAK